MSNEQPPGDDATTPLPDVPGAPEGSSPDVSSTAPSPSAPIGPPPSTGRRLGDRYELGDNLGRGGMAEVDSGMDLRLGRRVAVKILRADLARDSVFYSRFRREAQSAAALNHPNIVAVYDTGEDPLGGNADAIKVPYIVMEYVDGQTLRQLLSSGRRLLPERALEITAGILSALDYSHRHGIVHRDIKPANVMLTRSGEVKVMDFGIARAMADASSTLTATSAVMGTAQYLSPEQARGEMVDARSDLYSTGVVLYELLTGRPPFTGDSPVSVAYQHVSEPPVAPSQADPTVPPALDALVLKALAKRPEARYQSAAEFRTDVERAIAGMPTRASTNPVSPDDRTAVIPAVSAATAAALAPGDPNEPLDAPAGKASPWKWVGIVAAIIAVAAGAIFLATSLFGTTEVEKVNVPSVVGQTETQAAATLKAAGLILGTTPQQLNSDKPIDTIIDQDPRAGEQLQKGQAVNVTISAGKAKVPMPNLIALTSVADARKTLSDKGLNLGAATAVDSESPEGQIVSQSIDPGAMVDAGSSVDVEFSTGRVAVPSVINLSQAQATSDLVNAGFQTQVVELESSETPGTVLAQSPRPGEMAKRGTLVTITIAKAPPTPTETPTQTPTPTQTSTPPTPPPTSSAPVPPPSTPAPVSPPPTAANPTAT